MCHQKRFTFTCLLGFGTEPMYKRLCPWCSQSFSLLPPEDEQVSAVWKGTTLALIRMLHWLMAHIRLSQVRQTDRQPDHPVYILPALPLSLLDGIFSLPCLNAMGGLMPCMLKILWRKEASKKITYLALWRMEIWTELKLEHSASTFTHKKQTTVNGCLQTIYSFLLLKGHTNVFSSSPQHFLNCF